MIYFFHAKGIKKNTKGAKSALRALVFVGPFHATALQQFFIVISSVFCLLTSSIQHNRHDEHEDLLIFILIVDG